MSEISGLIITPLWREFMDVALAKIPAKSFAAPPSTPDTLKPILRGIWFDPTELVANNPEGGVGDINVQQAVLGAHSILYFVNKDNPRGPQPSNPNNDPQFSLWEYPVSLWKASLLGVGDQKDPEDTPEEEEDN
jgi:hypothetical protein